MRKLLFAALLLPLLSACTSSEPANAECDIIAVVLPAGDLSRQPVIGNRTVDITVTIDADVTALAPEFELTPGATINPPSGTARDFTDPQIYTVTSQDGQWSKDYVISVNRPDVISLQYSFENIRQISARGGKSIYDEFYEVKATGEEEFAWATANSAFVMTLQGTTPSTFPTYQGDEGVMGKCAVLVTRNTGTFGAGVGKPMAAGSLFMGRFDGTTAIANPLGATHFGEGMTFVQIPVYFSGSYRYKPGETYCTLNANKKLEEVPGKVDEFNIYAVLFETSDDVQYLNGANVLSADNPAIVATAEFTPGEKTFDNRWVTFKHPFRYRRAIDPAKLLQGKYSITVVASSSMDGDSFSGAIGSTLMVDELSIQCLENLEDYGGETSPSPQKR